MQQLIILNPDNSAIMENQDFFLKLQNRDIFNWQCSYCGEQHSDEKRNFIRREIKCPCQKRKIKAEKINLVLQKKHYYFLFNDEDSYQLSKTKSIDTKKPIKVKCLNCGKISYEYYGNISNGHKKCNCNPEKKFTRNCTNSEFIEKWHFLNKQNFILCENEVFTNRNSKYKIKCLNCGKEDYRWGISLIDGPIKCKYCNLGSKFEQIIGYYLDELKVKYIREYPLILDGHSYRFDFYLPEQNYIIEYHGEQHFKAYEHFGGEEKLKKIQQSDAIKKQWCLDNDIKFKQFDYTNSEEEIKEWLSLMFNDYPEREYTISD